MAEKSEIAWCDSTFNPWIGCTKVSPGCDHCYAERDFDLRKHVARWGAGNPRHRTSAANWQLPIRWQRQAEKFRIEQGRRRRVFCASLADVFDNEVPESWRADLFALIRETPDLDWLLLTKRIGNVRAMAPNGLPINVWLGATIVNQEEADRDIPKLLAIPAAVRWISAEPLLGPIDPRIGPPDNEIFIDYLTGTDDCDPPIPALDWVVVGEESGPRARPMSREWARYLLDECVTFKVPFFFKQMTDRHGRKIPWECVPADLQVRQYPTPRTAP